MLCAANVLSRPCLSWVNTSRAAYAAATAEIPPIPAVTTQGPQLTSVPGSDIRRRAAGQDNNRSDVQHSVAERNTDQDCFVTDWRPASRSPGFG
jgi:hypothetical protein